MIPTTSNPQPPLQISEEAREAANKLNNYVVDKPITLGRIDKIIQLAIDHSNSKLVEENRILSEFAEERTAENADYCNKLIAAEDEISKLKEQLERIVSDKAASRTVEWEVEVSKLKSERDSAEQMVCEMREALKSIVAFDEKANRAHRIASKALSLSAPIAGKWKKTPPESNP